MPGPATDSRLLPLTWPRSWSSLRGMPSPAEVRHSRVKRRSRPCPGGRRRQSSAWRAEDEGTMTPLYEDSWFTFRFAEDRLIPRFNLEGVQAGHRVTVFKV